MNMSRILTVILSICQIISLLILQKENTVHLRKPISFIWKVRGKANDKYNLLFFSFLVEAIILCNTPPIYFLSDTPHGENLPCYAVYILSCFACHCPNRYGSISFYIFCSYLYTDAPDEKNMEFTEIQLLLQEESDSA